MNRTVPTLLAIAVALLFVAPMGSAQIPNSNPVTKCAHECYPQDADVNGPDPKRGDAVVKTILYGHFEDILNRAPLNTQLPDKDKEPDLNRGFLMPVLSTQTGTELDFHFENNNFVMYSSAGLVEIVDGVWRTHQEPGLTEDVEVKSPTVKLYWYMSANPIPNGNSREFPGNTVNLAVVPQVAIKARMETGRNPYSSKSVVIAEGDTGDGDTGNLIGGPGRVNMVSLPGSDNVFEFVVPMVVKNAVIPSVASSAGFVVSIHPYQIRDKTGGHEVMQADWRVRTGSVFPPRLVLDIGNPMMNKAASLSLFDNAMFVRWSFVSPWGSYDTDDKSILLDISGPTKVDKKAAGIVDPLIIKRSVDHDGHFKPINATWKFNYKKANLADGEYLAKLSILNNQHTYLLEKELAFTVVNGVPDVKVIGGGSGKKGEGGQIKGVGGNAPGLEPVLLAATLAAAAVLLRRRKD